MVRATWERKWDFQAVHFLKDKVPLAIREDIEWLEKDLREHVNSLNMEDIRDEVVKWVQDPSSDLGRLLAYDCIIITYWVMKDLLSHVIRK